MNERTENLLLVAKLGRTVGLKGLLKLHIFSDFPAFFTPPCTLSARLGEDARTLTIDRYEPARNLIGFCGINTPEAARLITNYELFATAEATAQTIKLRGGEHFWHEIVGMQAAENGAVIGKIVEIREAVELLLVISIAGSDKRIVVPYNDHFVIGIHDSVLQMQHTVELIEAL